MNAIAFDDGAAAQRFTILADAIENFQNAAAAKTGAGTAFATESSTRSSASPRSFSG